MTNGLLILLLVLFGLRVAPGSGAMGLAGAYLVGGTVLAARFGRRVSRDLDFYVAEPFEPEELALGLDGIDRFAPARSQPALNG